MQGYSLKEKSRVSGCFASHQECLFPVMKTKQNKTKQNKKQTNLQSEPSDLEPHLLANSIAAEPCFGRRMEWEPHIYH